MLECCVAGWFRAGGQQKGLLIIGLFDEGRSKVLG